MCNRQAGLARQQLQRQARHRTKKKRRKNQRADRDQQQREAKDVHHKSGRQLKGLRCGLVLKGGLELRLRKEVRSLLKNSQTLQAISSQREESDHDREGSQ